MLGVACRDLLRFQPPTSSGASLSGEVENWFFDPTDTTPAVVLLLCAWLLWRRRRRLAALWGRSGPPALTGGLWTAAAAIFVWAVRSGAPDLQVLALVPTLLGVANLLGGTAALRVVAVPAAVLGLAVPIPAPLRNEILWKLQIGTADYTGLLLRTLGFHPVISGDRLFLGNDVFVLIESCSGLRSIQTLTLLAVLMLDLFERRGAHAVAVLIVVPFLAFAINGLRALGLIFNPHSDIAAVHNLQGIGMLLVGVLALYAWDGVLARLLPTSPPEAPPVAIGPRGGPASGRVAALAGFAALLLALSLLPRFTLPAVVPPDPASALADATEGWSFRDLPIDWVFQGNALFANPVNRRYTNGDDVVDVFLARAGLSVRLRSYYSAKTAYPGSGWRVEQEERKEIGGREATLRVIRKGGYRMLTAHWYVASPGLLAESVRALLALDSTPLRRSRFPQVVRLSTPMPAAPGARRRAEQRLERFATRLEPAVRELSAPVGS